MGPSRFVTIWSSLNELVVSKIRASGLPPEREVTKFRPSEPNALASGLAVPSSIPLTPDASANGSHGAVTVPRETREVVDEIAGCFAWNRFVLLIGAKKHGCETAVFGISKFYCRSKIGGHF